MAGSEAVSSAGGDANTGETHSGRIVPNAEGWHAARELVDTRPVSAMILAAMLAGPPHQDRPLEPRWPLLVDVAASYYLPTDFESRPIHSMFATAGIGTSFTRDRRVAAFGALTATAAWGHIIQLDDDFEEVRFDTVAGGAGPGFLLRGVPLSRRLVLLRLEVAVSLVLYAPNFPPGGDVYNFASQLGGSIAFRLRPHLVLGIGVRWMHVSNGRGLGPQNPAYEGVGFPISLDWAALLPRPSSPRAPRTKQETGRGDPPTGFLLRASSSQPMGES